jgi:hypothetical protein
MRILACCVFALATSTVFAPSSTELRYRYGTPDSESRSPDGILESENFTMRPGVFLIARYGSDGRACQMQVSHVLNLEELAQRPFAIDEILPEVLEELAPAQKRGEKFGERTKDSVLVTEYENVLIKQKQAPGVSDATIFFKREGCPNPPNPFVFSPPADPQTVHRLTPTAQGLRKRFGVTDSGVGDVFLVQPNIKLIVKYGSDDLACSIEMTPAEPSFPYMPKEKVPELLDELAPAAMRGKDLGTADFRSSACNGVRFTAYDNVLILRPPTSSCEPEHPGTERRVTIQFKRGVCTNPYASEKADQSKSR